MLNTQMRLNRKIKNFKVFPALAKKNQRYETIKRRLLRKPQTWLVTGCAGFIGSHLLEQLLLLKQRVVGLDNLSTGSRQNLSHVRRVVGPEAWKRFDFICGDVTKTLDCYKALHGHSKCSPRSKRRNGKPKINIILHQAGLGSVPRSMKNPLRTHDTNVNGMINLLWTAKELGVRRIIYATSSSVYGDSPFLPKKEEVIGELLSPYAVSKYVTELYAKVFGRCFGIETIGLRYFNVFGPRQNPAGAYAAVVPRWIGEMQAGEKNCIYGDGQTSRDFSFIENVVQANLLAATTSRQSALNQVYNVACGKATTLQKLHFMIRNTYEKSITHQKKSAKVMKIKSLSRGIDTQKNLVGTRDPVYLPERKGDVRHSLANITKARVFLGYRPTKKITEGIQKTVLSYLVQRR